MTTDTVPFPHIRGTTCCGLKEYAGLADKPTLSMFRLAKDWHSGMVSGAFCLFSDPVDFGRGRALAQFIEDNNLGKITRPGAARNPNSGRIIEIFIYEVDAVALRRWYDTVLPIALVEKEAYNAWYKRYKDHYVNRVSGGHFLEAAPTALYL